MVQKVESLQASLQWVKGERPYCGVRGGGVDAALICRGHGGLWSTPYENPQCHVAVICHWHSCATLLPTAQCCCCCCCCCPPSLTHTPPFYHLTAIRGTKNVSDVINDISGSSTALDEGRVHWGMMQVRFVQGLNNFMGPKGAPCTLPAAY